MGYIFDYFLQPWVVMCIERLIKEDRKYIAKLERAIIKTKDQTEQTELNLLQAIARVNRTSKGKECGYVVDYVGVFNHLKKALAKYKDEDIKETTGALLSVGSLSKFSNNLLAQNYLFKCIKK